MLDRYKLLAVSRYPTVFKQNFFVVVEIRQTKILEKVAKYMDQE